MKGFKVVLLVLFLSTSLAAFSQQLASESFYGLSGWQAASGDWKVINGRLAQTDTKETISVISFPVRQTGTVEYEFDLEYIGGGEDDYAGFGVHVAVTGPSKGRSWGNGKSLLAWATWDPKAYGYPGAFAQVYKSKGSGDMTLYPSGDIMEDGDRYPVLEEYLKYEYLDYKVPIKFSVDLNTGKGKFYDPKAVDRYYYNFDLGMPIPAGSYFSFRMNSLALSIDNFKARKLD